MLGTGNAEAQEHVTMLMLSLMVDPDNRLAIAKAGAVKRLVKQLKQMISLKAEELAAAALSYLTGDFTDASDDNIRDIKAEGGIEPLVELLKSESAEAQAHAVALGPSRLRRYSFQRPHSFATGLQLPPRWGTVLQVAWRLVAPT